MKRADRSPSAWRAVWLARLPEPWAGAFLLMLAEGTIVTPFIVVAVLYPLIAVAAARALESAQSLMMLAGLVLALGLARDVFTAVRAVGSAALLFQRPVSPDAHLLRAIALRAACVTAIQLLGALLLLIVVPLLGGSVRVVLAMVAGAWIWTAVVFCVAIGMDAAVEKQQTELTIALLLVSFLQGVVLNLTGLSGPLRTALSFLFVPIDGIFLLWEGMLNRVFEIGPADIIHLIIYPLAWLGLALAIARRRRSAQITAS